MIIIPPHFMEQHLTQRDNRKGKCPRQFHDKGRRPAPHRIYKRALSRVAVWTARRRPDGGQAATSLPTSVEAKGTSAASLEEKEISTASVEEKGMSTASGEEKGVSTTSVEEKGMSTASVEEKGMSTPVSKKRRCQQPASTRQSTFPFFGPRV